MSKMLSIKELHGFTNCVEFKWTINHQQNSSDNIYSPEFKLKLDNETKWKLIVHFPSRTGGYYNESRKMCVGLKPVDGVKSTILAAMNFEIRNDRGELFLKDSVVHCFSKLNEEHNSEQFLRPSQGYHVRGRDNDVTFYGSILLKGSLVIQHSKKNIAVVEPHSKNTSKLQLDLKNLLQSNMFADIEFQIENEVIRAHRNILSTRSVVFKKMFEQNMKEKENRSVKITDIEKPVFEVFLEYIYTSRISDKKFETIMPLYSTADKYAVDTLFKTCGEILTDYISDETVSSILKIADMHSDSSLIANAIDFICKNFARVEVTSTWDNLLDSDPRLASYTLRQVSVSAAKSTSK